MKKALLFGTTAFVAAGLLAAPAAHAFEVSVGGYMDQYIGYGNNDSDVAFGVGNADPQDVQVFSNVSVQITAQQTFEQTAVGALTIGAVVDLIGNDSQDRTADQNYAFLESDFGRVELGATYSGAYKSHVIAPNVGMPINNGELGNIMAGFGGTNGTHRTVMGGTFLEIGRTQNGQKITYMTPSFSGFSASVSYQPDVEVAAPFVAPASENLISDKDFDYHGGWAAGIAYNGQFNNVGVDASAGYYYAKAPDVGALDNYKGYNLGLALSAMYNGAEVAVGGSYARTQETTGLDAIGGFPLEDGSAWDLGVSYDTGIWAASFTYQRGRSDVFGADIDIDTFALGTRYKIGEGAHLTGTLGHVKAEWASALDVNKGFFAAAGVHIDF